MGECPEWYVVLKAAKYLNVAPWELIRQPFQWTNWALQAIRAENAAEEQKQRNNKRRAKAFGNG